MRDRLIELLKEAHESWLRYVDECAFNQTALSFSFEQMFADHLLAEGIIVPPCKVGQTVYHFSRDLGAVFPYFVENLNIGSMGKNKTYWNYEANYHDEETDELIDEIDFDLDDIGKTVFLTRHEAEQALAERRRDGK